MAHRTSPSPALSGTRQPSRGASRFRRTLAIILVAGLAVLVSPTQSQTMPDETFRAGEGLTVTAPFDTGSVLNGSYPIDSLGYAEIPVVGKVAVGGRSRAEVEAQISKKLAEYLRDANVYITPTVRITFLGHWVRPGMYYVSPEASVWDIFRIAGGPAGERNLELLTVQRGNDPAAVDLLGAFAQGKTFRASGLRSGDIVKLPVPNERDAWYWFRESLGVTAQLATVMSTLLTAYVTYLIYDSENP
jgi:protein involved in polysaccharide export with SLBB domain